MRASRYDLFVEDNLIKVVFLRWKLSPVILWLVAGISTWLFFGIVRLLTGEFISTNGMRGFVDDYNFYQQCAIGIPSVVVFYTLVPKFIKDCFDQLTQNGVFGQNVYTEGEEYTFSAFLDQVRKSLSSRTFVWISFGGAGIFMILAVPQHVRMSWWAVDPALKHLVSLALMDLYWWLMFGLVILLAIRAVVGIWWINQAFKRFKIIVRPLYPDGAGGLQPLSQFSLRLGYIIFFFGLELGMNQVVTSYYLTGQWGKVFWTPDTLLPWIVYLALAPVVFFAPIAAAHDAMRDAKENELKFIASVFEEEYKSLRRSLGSDLNSVRTHARKIEELQKLYNMVKSFPVWPFQAQKFAQFFGTILSPLLLTTLSTLITTSISKWLGP